MPGLYNQIFWEATYLMSLLMKTLNFNITKRIITILFLFIISRIAFTQDEVVLTGKIEVDKLYDDEEIFAVIKVVTATKDEEGNLVVSIEEYPIEDNIMGKRLYQLNGKTVEAIGTLFEDNYGPVWFSVNSFKLIEAVDDKNQDKMENQDKPDN
jgi:hypothetical protein